MNEEIQKELKIVKQEARKSYEKARDGNQMEAAAMFLAQIERMLSHQMWLETLMDQLKQTDPMRWEETGVTPTADLTQETALPAQE